MKQIFTVISIAFVFLFLFISVSAQVSGSLPKQQEAMKKLDFLVGNWRGSGWIMFGADNRKTFNIDESVQIKLDGLVLIIEGIGKSGDKVIYNFCISGSVSQHYR